MTRRELVTAAIEHRETERAPYCIQLCGDAWDALKPRTQAEDALAFCDNDILEVSPPWWTWYDNPTDWYKPPTPTSRRTTRGTGSFDAFYDNLKAQRDKSDKYFLAMIYGSHFEKAYSARGFENLMADFAADPAWTKKFLSQIVDKNMVMLENILSAPEIDGVLLGSDWGSQIDLLMSPTVWEDMIRPGEQREYDLVHSYGKHVWVHSCGCIEKVIPSLIEMGLDVLNPIQPEAMDIASLKQKYGSRLAFWGGLSTQQTLPFGTPDELRVEARRVRDMMSKGGGYIFAPAQSIQNDVSPANIIALLEVARENRCSK